MSDEPKVIVSESYETLREWLRGDVVGFILGGEPRRLGGRAFMTFLEYRHFPPRSPVNAEFCLVTMKWEGIIWNVVIIPKAKRGLADALMSELGLRAANGVPHVFTNQGQAHFPVDVPNLFTIENVAGHFVYRNEPASQKTAYDFEDEACDKVIAEHERARHP